MGKNEVRLEGRVEMHLAGGRSKVAVYLGGSNLLDVATEDIPQHLRTVGSKVLVIFQPGEKVVKAPSGEEFYPYEGVIIQDLPADTQLGFIPLQS